MAIAFGAGAQTLRELFCGDVDYQVPVFQRSYAWDTEKAIALLDDIMTRWADGRDDTGGAAAGHSVAPYFLGAVVFLDKSDPDALGDQEAGSAGARKLYDIVDGQQRLITLTLILAILRDLALGDEAFSDADELRRAVVTDARTSDGTAATVLAPRPEDALFFWDTVQSDGATLGDSDDEPMAASLKRVVENRDALRLKLVAVDPEQRGDLGRFVLDSCPLISARTNDIENAFDIYLKLNVTSEDLAPADIIKANALSRCTSEAEERRLDQVWMQCERGLGAKRFEELFSFIRTMHGDTRKPILPENLRLLAEKPGPGDFVEGVIEPGARWLKRVRSAADADNAEDADIRRWLIYLGWVGHSEWVPVVMSWFERHDTNKRRTLAFLQTLDRLVYGLLVLGFGQSRRAIRFRRIVVALRDNDAFESIPEMSLTADEQRMILYHMSTDLHGRSRQTCRLVLQRIEDHIGGLLTPRPQTGWTIEHILPRRAGRSQAWANAFPDAEARQIAIRLLGNTALVSSQDNGSARNADFAEKQAIFFRRDGPHPFQITQELSELPAWTQTELAARDARFMNIVRELWGFQGPAGLEIDFSPRGE